MLTCFTSCQHALLAADMLLIYIQRLQVWVQKSSRKSMSAASKACPLLISIVHLQRLQVLVHIYTRVQEELEKKAKPAGTEIDCLLVQTYKY